MSMRMRIRFAGVFLVLASALAWGQRVEDCFSRDPGPLDFIRGEGPEQSILQALTGEALVGLDDHGRVVPRLASSWRMDRNGSLRFRLRTDARFEDGAPVRPEDALWTFQAIQADPSASPTKRAILDGVQVRVEGNRFVLSSRKPSGRLLMELARIPVAEREHPDRGSGPFRLQREPGAWRLDRRTPAQAPAIPGLRFRLLPDSASQYQALLKGWLTLGQPPAHLLDAPPPAYRRVVQPKAFQLVVWSRLGPGPLQAMERWRRDAFPPHLLGSGARPSRGLLPEALGFPARTIEAAPGPVPRDRPLPLLYAAGDAPVEKLLMALRARALRDGIRLEPVPVDEALLISRLQAGTFELACFVATFDPEPWSVLEYMEPDGPMNFTGWRSPALASVVARLQAPGDPAWEALQHLWARAPGALPLVDFQSVLWVDRRLRITTGPLGLYLGSPGPAGWTWRP